MPLVPDPPVASADLRPPLSTKELKPTNLNPNEMDSVAMRIFRELRTQLSMVENKNAQELTASDHEKCARVLASLERTLERLAKVEAGRAAARKSIAGMSDDDKRKLILRRLSVSASLERAGENFQPAE